jgi:hypothetical protein
MAVKRVEIGLLRYFSSQKTFILGFFSHFAVSCEWLRFFSR